MADGTRMLQRRATEATWSTSNYILGTGEIGVATDTLIIKIGDGVNEWSELLPALGSEYLPILGTAYDSARLGGIAADSYLKDGEAPTFSEMNLATTNAISAAMAGPISSSIAGAYNASLIEGRKNIISRTITNANLTLEAADVGRMISVVNDEWNADRICNIPTNAAVPIPIGSTIDIIGSGACAVKLMPAGGVLLRGANIIFGQFSVMRIVKTGTDDWLTVWVRNSPGPELRRRIAAGTSIPNAANYAIPMSNSITGLDTPSRPRDSLGVNKQSIPEFPNDVYCRRSGHYDIVAQYALSASGGGRFFINIWINGVAQNVGRGQTRGSAAEMTVGLNTTLPLNFGDVINVVAYQDTGGALAVSDSPYSASYFQWKWVRPL